MIISYEKFDVLVISQGRKGVEKITMSKFYIMDMLAKIPG